MSFTYHILTQNYRIIERLYTFWLYWKAALNVIRTKIAVDYQNTFGVPHVSRITHFLKTRTVQCRVSYLLQITGVDLTIFEMMN